MPKIIEYPRASFKNSLKLAKAVDDLGGSCDKKTCAEKMGKKITGGFSDLIAATSKFGFIKRSKGLLYLEQNYKDYKLAYNEDERIEVLRKSFFSIPLFKKIYDKYKDVKLEVNLLPKILVREFEVQQKMSSRAAGYFVDAAKQIRLLNPDNSFNKLNGSPESSEESTGDSEENEIQSGQQKLLKMTPKSTNYVVQITGPNINQTIEIEEVDHLSLVEAAMGIIKKKLSMPKDEDTESTD